MTCIVWEKPDGSIMVHHPAENTRKPGESDVAFLIRKEARAREASPEDFIGTVHLGNCEREELPPSRRFRNCWRGDRGKVNVDMPLAREQRMGEIRLERNTLLDESDKEKARLDDVGTTSQKTAIGTYRQALRDLPASIDLEAIRNPEALGAFDPVWPVAP